MSKFLASLKPLIFQSIYEPFHNSVGGVGAGVGAVIVCDSGGGANSHASHASHALPYTCARARAYIYNTVGSVGGVGILILLLYFNMLYSHTLSHASHSDAVSRRNPHACMKKAIKYGGDNGR